MKWYKVCNRISLLLHALCSALGYFLIEMISRRSFSAAWTYMTTKPLVFAYNLSEATAPVKLPVWHCPTAGSRRLVRNPILQGWYPNSGSMATGVTIS